MSNESILVLHRRLRAPDSLTLHYRELELRLSDDRQHLVLGRHTELYGEAQQRWARVNHHQVPITQLLRWMVEQGHDAGPPHAG